MCSDSSTGEERRAKSEDSKMVKEIGKTMNREFTLDEPVEISSLNIVRRKQELRNITNSNLKLLSKIENVRSYYSASKLEKDYRQSLRYSLNSSYSLRKFCEDIVRDLKEQEKATSI